jgi:hypothetical protein
VRRENAIKRTSKAAARANEQAARARAFTAAADMAAYQTSWRRGYAVWLKRGEHHGRESLDRRQGPEGQGGRRSARGSRCQRSDRLRADTRRAVRGARPGVTGHSCPSGSVPNADGGVVCVPQFLIEEKNTTPSVNSPKGQHALEGRNVRTCPRPRRDTKVRSKC